MSDLDYDAAMQLLEDPAQAPWPEIRSPRRNGSSSDLRLGPERQRHIPAEQIRRARWRGHDVAELRVCAVGSG